MKLGIVISGQGPVAFGMPEMFTPMQHINANRAMRKLATLISDGRYSGVVDVSHMTGSVCVAGIWLRNAIGLGVWVRVASPA